VKYHLKHHRHSVRLKGYDYSQSGAYFITICTNGRQCVLGEFWEGTIILNENGRIVNNERLKTSEIRQNVTLDEYIIMPNHIHGIINIVETNNNVGAHGNVPLQIEKFGKSTSNSIPTIIKLFKSTVTKQINIIRGTPGEKFWQRNYYEHIIRNGDELNKIREYIIYNPLKWELDNKNPENWNLQI